MTTTTNPIPFNFTPTPPGLKDLLNTFEKSLLINFNCHHLGTVQSFDPEQQTAEVTINYQRTFFNLNSLTQQYEQVQVPYPVLAECPVVILSGNKTALTFPIAKGDECIVLFNDRDIDNWFAGSTTAGVATPRLHSFSDGLILVGVNSLQYTFDDYDTVRAMLRAGEESGSIAAVGVNPETLKVLVTNTYPANTETLRTLLQDLCSDVQDLISSLTTNAADFILVTGTPGSPSPINPAIVASLTNVSTSLTALSTQIGGMLE